MNIGILSEAHPLENRVGLTPAGAHKLVCAGHSVFLESSAGEAARFSDEEYRKAGARVAFDREEVIGRADLLLKVAPLKPADAALLDGGQTVVGFHHLAASSRELLDEVMGRGVTLIGYEVIEDPLGDLPILHSMSEIAGQLAVHLAAHYLETRAGGRGILLGGATAIPPAHVVILGASVVGRWAARLASANGARVTLLDTRLDALRRAAEWLDHGPITGIADPREVSRAVSCADVLIGAVLVKGERTPHLVTADMIEGMKPGAVVIDVSIDQGGCVETSRPTTMDDPVYVESGVTHFAVPNMTSAVARTASLALTHASLQYIESLANDGIDLALRDCAGLRAGVYTYRGELVFEGVARTFSKGCQSLEDLLGLPARGDPAVAGEAP